MQRPRIAAQNEFQAHLADRGRVAFNAAMKMPPNDTHVKSNGLRRGRWLIVLTVFAALVWSLPRPRFVNVEIDSTDDSSSSIPPRGRLAFQTAILLGELSGKGSLADETELSGPCFGEDVQTLYFSRSQPGQRANIVRSTFDGERWAKPELVRELNSVDDDRRLTLTGDKHTAALASNRSGGHGGFDLYESTNDGSRWTRPRNAGPTINSDADEFDPALTPDGLTMFFVRVVSGAGAELFVTRREQFDAAWSAPESVAIVNSPITHERSPSVSPDGRWLLFSSNRGARSGETSPFSLFRAPLHDGQVGAPERFSDGIASDEDDLDATLSPDGRTLAFVSKRDGPKQLFLSRGDFVVARLMFSTAHLDRFGQPKWGMPVLSVLFLILTWRWARRVRVVQVATESASPAIAARVVLRRSEPLKNPLANWTNTELIDVPPEPKKINPLLASASFPRISTAPPAEVVSERLPSRESVRPSRRRAAVALFVVAASLVVALQFDFWRISENSNDSPFFDGALWLQFVNFEDVATTPPTESSKLDRFDTARADAPKPSPIPSVAVALRPGARWPNDRVVVRTPAEVSRVAGIEPLTSKQTRQAVLARRSRSTEFNRPTTRPADETTLASVILAFETPLAVVPPNTSRLNFDPPASDRTIVPPATASRASLPKPVSRLDQLAVLPPIVLSPGIQPLRSLARGGASTRSVELSGIVEPQDLSGLIVLRPMESPLPQQSMSVSRSETPAAGHPPAADAKAARSLPPKLNSLVDHFSSWPALAGSSGIEVLRSLARHDVSSRAAEPIALAEPQVLTEVSAVILEERPLPKDAVVLSRSETPLVGQPSVTDPPAFQWRPTANNFAAQIEGPSVDPSEFIVRHLSKLPTAINLALLTEESTLLPNDRVTESDNSPAKANLSRSENQGPQPKLSATESATFVFNLAESTRLRRPIRIDAETSAEALAFNEPLPLPLSQRVSRTPVVAAVSAEAAFEPMPGGPAILLTSATMLVELLALPVLPPLPHAELVGPAPSVTSEPFSGLAQWFSRTAKPTALDGANSTTPLPSPIPVSALPRRERTLTPAELPEDPK